MGDLVAHGKMGTSYKYGEKEGLHKDRTVLAIHEYGGFSQLGIHLQGFLFPY